jgi:hypothetical protein
MPVINSEKETSVISTLGAMSEEEAAERATIFILRGSLFRAETREEAEKIRTKIFGFMEDLQQKDRGRTPAYGHAEIVLGAYAGDRDLLRKGRVHIGDGREDSYQRHVTLALASAARGNRIREIWHNFWSAYRHLVPWPWG